MPSNIRSSDTPSSSPHESEVRALYQKLLDGWNRGDAAAMAVLYAEDASLVGFDGIQVDRAIEIQSHLRQIFADHQPPAFVAIVRAVRFLTPEVALLRAVAGLVPPGQSDVNPALNMIQTLVAVRQEDQ